MATAIFTMNVGAGRFPFLPVVIFISIGGKIVRYSGLFPVAVFPEQATTIIVAPIIIITVIVTALCSVVLRSVVAVIALFPRIVVNSNANPWIRLVLGSRKDSRKSKLRCGRLQLPVLYYSITLGGFSCQTDRHPRMTLHVMDRGNTQSLMTTFVESLDG